MVDLLVQVCLQTFCNLKSHIKLHYLIIGTEILHNIITDNSGEIEEAAYMGVVDGVNYKVTSECQPMIAASMLCDP